MEGLLLARMRDLAAAARKQWCVMYTGFMDPISASEAYSSFSNERGLTAYIFGGFEGAERKMLAVAPEELAVETTEFPIDVLKISYDTRFNSVLAHRDFLGSILGLGIDRARVGDIVIDNNIAHAFVCREISGYITANLERAGKIKVKAALSNCDFNIPTNGTELRMTIASPRLDAIISAVFHISRAKAQSYISSERVFVNWRILSSPSYQIIQDDIISIRGLGRLKIIAFSGLTKKGRLCVCVLKF